MECTPETKNEFWTQLKQTDINPMHVYMVMQIDEYHARALKEFDGLDDKKSKAFVCGGLAEQARFIFRYLRTVESLKQMNTILALTRKYSGYTTPRYDSVAEMIGRLKDMHHARNRAIINRVQEKDKGQGYNR